MAIVKLKLRRTSEAGFLVILTATDWDFETEGILPPLPPELESSFHQWQSAYRQLDAVRSCIAPSPGLRLTPKSVMIHSNLEHTQAVKDYLNQWLNSGDSQWQPIRDGLIAFAQQLHQANEQKEGVSSLPFPKESSKKIAKFQAPSFQGGTNPKSDDEIRVILDTKDINLRRLPWQEWSLFEQHYPHAEIALSAPRGYEKKELKRLPSSLSVRILVVVGRSDGINTKDDLEVIQNLEKLGAEVVCLMQPSLKELCEALWDEQGYHIFIFTGHSGSREDGQIGWIEVNDSESLSIEQFKDALQEAIAKGLQLAIFNSCDGLGLANQLAELQLPQSIVMREPVPDPVAVDFLKYFFNEFTQNTSLFASVQTARKRLEHFKSDYPGAVWLPTICIMPSVEPLTWQKLQGSSPKPLFKPELQPKIGVIAAGLFGAVASFVMVLSQRYPLALPNSTLEHPKLLSTPYQTFAEVLNVPKGTWSYGGSTAWAKIRDKADKQIKKKLHGFNLTLTQHPTLPLGSGMGIEMLLKGQLSFSQSSRPIKDSEYKMAEFRGVKLKQVPVAIDAIAIVVHPSLDVKGLTLEQLKDIYSGRITNWNQVGGPNLKITPYSSPIGSGGTELLKEEVLGDQNVGTNVVYVKTPSEALIKVGQSPKHESEYGGIYFASAPNLIGQCNVKPLAIARNLKEEFIPPYQGSLVPREKCPAQRNKLNVEAIQNGKYPLIRRLFVVIKQDDHVDEQAGDAYAKLLLTEEGQRLIQEAGFIPIRSF